MEHHNYRLSSPRRGGARDYALPDRIVEQLGPSYTGLVEVSRRDETWSDHDAVVVPALLRSFGLRDGDYPTDRDVPPYTSYSVGVTPPPSLTSMLSGGGYEVELIVWRADGRPWSIEDVARFGSGLWASVEADRGDGQPAVRQ
jgi:hypothetical protein